MRHQQKNRAGASIDNFSEHVEFTARLLGPSDMQSLATCQRLRHEYFVRQRNWVAPCRHEVHETDHYDPYCQHLAVFHNSNVMAYMRLLPWQQETNGFMLENEFACLLTPQEHKIIVREDSVELSRLVIAPGACSQFSCGERQSALSEARAVSATMSDKSVPSSDGMNGVVCQALEPEPYVPHVLEMLLKLLYHVSQDQGIRVFYIVVESAGLAVLRSKFGIHFKAIGKSYTFPDGTQTVAAVTTLEEIEASIKQRWPDKYQWYRQRP